MNDAVFVQTLGLAISMGAIVVAATAAGLLLCWFEGRADHGEEH
jgi:hypothetical protein